MPPAGGGVASARHTNMIKAIETRYKGYRFRSRLEARWAVFFDALGIKWEYEPEGYDLGEVGWYLPDFRLPEHDLWIEVKGQTPDDAELQKATKLGEKLYQATLIVSGNIGEHKWECCFDANKEASWPLLVGAMDNSLTISIFQGPEEKFGPMWLVCPFCNDTNGTEIVSIESDSESGWIYNDDNTRGARYRWGLRLACNWFHAWSVNCLELDVYGQSRVGLYFGGANVINKPLVFMDDARSDEIGHWLARGNVKGYDSAITAARSARFEHGETP